MAELLRALLPAALFGPDSRTSAAESPAGPSPTDTGIRGAAAAAVAAADDVDDVEEPRLSASNFGVTELMILNTLDRALAAKQQWSRAVRAAQTSAKNLNLLAGRTAEPVVLESDGPADRPYTGHAVDLAFLCTDVFVTVREAEKAVDAPISHFARMLVKYRILYPLEDLLDVGPLDPVPWKTVSLRAVRDALLTVFAEQSARLPLNGFGPAVVPADAIDTASMDSIDELLAAYSAPPSHAAPKRLGFGLVGSSMPTPQQTRPTHLDRRPNTLVNYNNTVSAGFKFISPPTSAHPAITGVAVPSALTAAVAAGLTSSQAVPETAAIDADDATSLGSGSLGHLADSGSTDTGVAPAAPTRVPRAVAHQAPPLLQDQGLALNVPAIRAANRAGPTIDEASPLIFDKNRYIGFGAGTLDSPLTTPFPSPALHGSFAGAMGSPDEQHHPASSSSSASPQQQQPRPTALLAPPAAVSIVADAQLHSVTYDYTVNRRLLYNHDRVEACRIICRAWLSFRNRSIFNHLKAMLLRSRLSPMEAQLLKDPVTQARIRFRFGGAHFPPHVMYKIFTHGAGVHYISGVHAIAPGSVAARDAWRLMGNSRYLTTCVGDDWTIHARHHDARHGRRGVPVGHPDLVTNPLERIQYVSGLDRRGPALGGRANGWRVLDGFPVTGIAAAWAPGAAARAAANNPASRRSSRGSVAPGTATGSMVATGDFGSRQPSRPAGTATGRPAWAASASGRDHTPGASHPVQPHARGPLFTAADLSRTPSPPNGAAVSAGRPLMTRAERERARRRRQIERLRNLYLKGVREGDVGGVGDDGSVDDGRSSSLSRTTGAGAGARYYLDDGRSEVTDATGAVARTEGWVRGTPFHEHHVGGGSVVGGHGRGEVEDLDDFGELFTWSTGLNMDAYNF
ncbi:hypothetical protein H9P43_001566 [Blastocladiella emersonii ATCC 22665]|nr:hypothetical protein H9P43_001566 [Blastocladiella emersonii ATCC 22665]